MSNSGLHIGYLNRKAYISQKTKKNKSISKQAQKCMKIIKKKAVTQTNKLKRLSIKPNIAVVEPPLYPSIVLSSMGVEAAIAMRYITIDSEEKRRGITAFSLANKLHFGPEECVSMLDTFHRAGYIEQTYMFEENDANIADFDIAYSKVYRINPKIYLIGKNVTVRETAITLSHAKEISIFVVSQSALRICSGVQQAAKRRSL